MAEAGGGEEAATPPRVAAPPPAPRRPQRRRELPREQAVVPRARLAPPGVSAQHTAGRHRRCSSVAVHLQRLKGGAGLGAGPSRRAVREHCSRLLVRRIVEGGRAGLKPPLPGPGPAQPPPPQPVHYSRVEFTADGRRMVAARGGDHAVVVHSPPPPAGGPARVVWLLGHPRTAWALACHPTRSNLVASGCLGGAVRLWDLDAAEPVGARDYPGPVSALAFHPSGDWLLVGCGRDFHVWDVGVLLAHGQHEVERWHSDHTGLFPDYIRGVLFDVPGRHIAMVQAEPCVPTLRVWALSDLNLASRPPVLEVPASPFSCCSTSPCGRWLAFAGVPSPGVGDACGRGRTVVGLLSLAGGGPPRRVRDQPELPFQETISALSFSADGGTLAVACSYPGSVSLRSHVCFLDTRARTARSSPLDLGLGDEAVAWQWIGVLDLANTKVNLLRFHPTAPALVLACSRGLWISRGASETVEADGSAEAGGAGAGGTEVAAAVTGRGLSTSL